VEARDTTINISHVSLEEVKKIVEEKTTALNETATEAPVTTPVTETEAPKTEEVKSEGKTEDTTQVEEGSNKTANARIRELNAKAKAAEEKSKSLSEQIAELTRSVEPGATQYTPQIQPGTEVSREQYENDVAQRADALVQLRMKQKEVLDNVNNESREAVKTYPQLDPSSEEFDKELSESISTATMAMISRTPTASVKKFVSSLMKPYLRSVGREVGKAQGEMAKQVTQTALRPTTVKAKEKTSKEMTTKELEEKLGIVY
jgi:hypothetical protein